MIIAVDFDGTIVQHEYPNIGKPVPFAFEVLKKLQQEEHHLLILWSVREGDLLKEAVDFCAKNGLEFYAVNSNYPEETEGEQPRKINADLYIDDKNIGGLPDWGVIYRMIKSGSNDLMNFEDVDDERPQRRKNFLIRLGEIWENNKRYGY
ncbi:MAG: hypothetical protein LBR64_04050 [Dysgonamonadaceae bacterium]|jgi:hypothetical protein|nr:hypothetical protein [Dysgonamonadaceae bacterium]